MLLNTITVKHPKSFALLKPKSRDEQNHVRDWKVLNTAKKYDDILKIAEYYRSEGISNAVYLVRVMSLLFHQRSQLNFSECIMT